MSIVIPAFNEEKTVADTVHAAVASDYMGPLEIVVVNDGSQDATLQVLVREFNLAQVDWTLLSNCPHKPLKRLYGATIGRATLVVADKENGGKADALNAGINLCSGAYVCVIDADTRLEGSALSSLWKAIAAEPTIVAAGGIIGLSNSQERGTHRVLDVHRFRRLLTGLQIIEYARAFTVGRLAANRLGLLTLISGAFGIFRRAVLLDVGGYRRDTVGEDYEIVVRIHRLMLENNKPYKIRFIPSAVAWTEAPDTLGGLIAQRSRWQRGALQTFIRHRDMAWNPRYGRIGVIGVGTIAINDFLIPLVCLLGILTILVSCSAAILSWTFLMALMAFLVLTSLVADIHAVRTFTRIAKIETTLQMGTGRLIWLSITDGLLFRHLVLLFRLYGILQQIKQPNKWGVIERRGTMTHTAFVGAEALRK